MMADVSIWLHYMNYDSTIFQHAISITHFMGKLVVWIKGNIFTNGGKSPLYAETFQLVIYMKSK